MSSFGSSLINKGKKVVPKAGGRRRPEATPSAPSNINASTSQEEIAPSERSSIEPLSTPQPEVDRNVEVLPTPDPIRAQTPSAVPFQASIEKSAAGDVLEAVPVISTHRPSEELPARIEARVTASQPGVPTDESLLSVAQELARRRSQTPADQPSSPNKRRRLNPSQGTRASIEPPTIRNPSPAVIVPAAPAIANDEIPVIQVRTRASTNAADGRRTRRGGANDNDSARADTPSDLVQYEAPTTETQATAPRKVSRSAVAPLLTTSVAGPKPARKGSRRQTWQITTLADLAPKSSSTGASSTSQLLDSIQDDDDDTISIVTPKARKVRKDKGVRKGPRAGGAQAAQSEGAANTTPIAQQNGVASSVSSQCLSGRRIAPRPSPNSITASTNPESAAREDVVDQEEESEEDGPIEATNTTASARLRNAQKRKAKQRALGAAQSRTAATLTAAAIDDVVAQSVEGQIPSARMSMSRANPLFRVRLQEGLRSRRSGSAGSDATDLSAVSEAGTFVRRRHNRQATPEGHESVFITEKVTPMSSLIGRDTENRVGMRSTREMRMREVDWKEVRRQQKEQDRANAIAKGSRRSNVPLRDDSTRDNTPLTQSKRKKSEGDAEGVDGEGGDEGAEEDSESQSDDDELERLIKARELRHGPTGVSIHMVNGEHRIDESGIHQRGASEEIDDQIMGMTMVEDDDLTKSFNVQTYMNWNRRDPNERVVQTTRWTDDETERFYDALRCCGVDFGSMAEWFPHRIRRSLKRKFNMEERSNPDRIEETLRAHLMIMAGDGPAGAGDGLQSWDINTFVDNNAFRVNDLLDPKAVEEELRLLRLEKEKEIELARLELAEEKRQKQLAGVEDDDEQEEDDGEKEPTFNDLIVQLSNERDQLRKKAKKAAAAVNGDQEEDAEAGAEEDEVEDGEDEAEDDEAANDGAEEEVAEEEEGEEVDLENADWDD